MNYFKGGDQHVVAVHSLAPGMPSVHPTKMMSRASFKNASYTMYREEQTAKLVCTSLCTAHSSEESERKRLLGRLVSVCAENENEKSRRKKEKKRKNYCVSSALTVLGLCNSRSSAMIDGCDLVAPTAADLLHDQLTSTVLYGRAERTALQNTEQPLLPIVQCVTEALATRGKFPTAWCVFLRVGKTKHESECCRQL